MNIYHKILELIDQHDSFAISAHVNPDGDSIGAQLALYSFLVDLNKYVRIFNTDPIPSNYHFLPFSEKIEQLDIKLETNVILAGDFNFYFNKTLEAEGGNPKTKIQSKRGVQKSMQRFRENL